MYRYLCIVIIPALVFACCPPKQWEGKEYVALGSTDSEGKSHYTEIEQHVSVDADRRLVYAQQLLITDGKRSNQTVVQNFNSATQFVMHDGKCDKMGITSLEPGCLPQNATAVLKSFMGAGNSKMATTVYKIDTGATVAYATMADDGCIPLVYEASGTDANGGGFQMTVEFFGITAGIRDRTVFSEPKTCSVPTPAFAGVGIGR